MKKNEPFSKEELAKLKRAKRTTILSLLLFAGFIIALIYFMVYSLKNVQEVQIVQNASVKSVDSVGAIKDSMAAQYQDLEQKVTDTVLIAKSIAVPVKTKPFVRLYKRSDNDKLEVALRDAGVRIMIMKVPEELSSYPTNSLRYGFNVDAGFVRKIATLMIANGIELKQIAKFDTLNYKGFKANAVEVNSNIRVSGRSNIKGSDLPTIGIPK